MNVLVARQGIELLDSGFDVVAQHPLTGRDRIKVDLLNDPLVVGDRRLGHLGTEFALCPQHRQPESAFGDDFGLR